MTKACQCPRCGMVFHVTEEWLGKQGRCSQCKQVIVAEVRPNSVVSIEKPDPVSQEEVRAILERVRRKHSDNRLSIQSLNAFCSITPRKVDAARRRFAFQMQPDEQAIFFRDTSFLGNGTRGFLITNRALYSSSTKTLWHYPRISLERVQTVKVLGDQLIVNGDVVARAPELHAVQQSVGGIILDLLRMLAEIQRDKPAHKQRTELQQLASPVAAGLCGGQRPSDVERYLVHDGLNAPAAKTIADMAGAVLGKSVSLPVERRNMRRLLLISIAGLVLSAPSLLFGLLVLSQVFGELRQLHLAGFAAPMIVSFLIAIGIDLSRMSHKRGVGTPWTTFACMGFWMLLIPFRIGGRIQRGGAGSIVEGAMWGGLLTGLGIMFLINSITFLIMGVRMMDSGKLTVDDASAVAMLRERLLTLQVAPE